MDSASSIAMVEKRVDAGDAAAMHYLGSQYSGGGTRGELGLEKDLRRAIELWTKAAELGSIDAHFELGRSYYNGNGVGQDQAKGIGHWQHAAMKGDVDSRYSLGDAEYNKGNYHLALKHFLISAKIGDKPSLDGVKELFIDGVATKAQYAEALKGYQKAVEETKSHAARKSHAGDS